MQIYSQQPSKGYAAILLYQRVSSQNNHNLKANVQVLQRLSLSITEYLHTDEVTAW